MRVFLVDGMLKGDLTVSAVLSSMLATQFFMDDRTLITMPNMQTNSKTQKQFTTLAEA
jgi:hypothetical protein